MKLLNTVLINSLMVSVIGFAAGVSLSLAPTSLAYAQAASDVKPS